MAVGHTEKQTTHASAVMTQDIRLRNTGKVNCKSTKAACESRESLLLAFPGSMCCCAVCGRCARWHCTLVTSVLLHATTTKNTTDSTVAFGSKLRAGVAGIGASAVAPLHKPASLPLPRLQKLNSNSNSLLRFL